MAKQMCLMPAKCVKCGEIFDISYDYKLKKEDMTEEEMEFVDSESKLLCWECRLKEELEGKKEESQIDE